MIGTFACFAFPNQRFIITLSTLSSSLAVKSRENPDDGLALACVSSQLSLTRVDPCSPAFAGFAFPNQRFIITLSNTLSSSLAVESKENPDDGLALACSSP